jgi:hypothetical protein
VTRARVNDLSAPAKEARAFDRWFDSLPKAKQDKLRDGGVIPYREMVQSRNVFEVQPEHPSWSTDRETTRNIMMGEVTTRTETDTFISRDHVGVMLKAFIDALAMTNDFRVRRHVELVRWTLGLPGCLSAPDIAMMYGITKQALHKRGEQIRATLPKDALGGWQTHRRKKTA